MVAASALMLMQRWQSSAAAMWLKTAMVALTRSSDRQCGKPYLAHLAQYLVEYQEPLFSVICGRDISVCSAMKALI